MQQRHRAWVLLFRVLLAACFAAGQQASTPVTVQLLSNPLQLVADFYDDDPTASCSTSNVVAVTVDGLLAAQQPASPATVVVSTSFSMSQLLEAEVFSTAGLTVSLLQQSGGHGCRGLGCVGQACVAASLTTAVCLPCRPGCRVLSNRLGQVPSRHCHTGAGPINQRPAVPHVCQHSMPVAISGEFAARPSSCEDKGCHVLLVICSVPSLYLILWHKVCLDR
jgi:hypothetical protein